MYSKVQMQIFSLFHIFNYQYHTYKSKLGLFLDFLPYTYTEIKHFSWSYKNLIVQSKQRGQKFELK